MFIIGKQSIAQVVVFLMQLILFLLNLTYKNMEL
jgi:hypothetical protein